MIVASFGGGTNSTALLVGMKERGIRPDYITFADTGGEKPHTYAHNEIMREWCKENDFPDIITVKSVDKNGAVVVLEDRCIANNMLPSIAYGFKSCSHRHKIAPQDKYFNNLAAAKDHWKSGRKITKYIGYDADEERRASISDDDKYNYEYPLIEWGWGRDECVNAIAEAGLPLPGKSSCFYCPSSKPTEIKWLAAKHPELMSRAIAMERNADLHTVKGLGRNFRWEDVLATDDMFEDNFIELACGCYEGD